MSFQHFTDLERLEIIHNLNIELCSRFVWIMNRTDGVVPEKQPDNRYNEDDRKTVTKITSCGRTPGAGRTTPPLRLLYGNGYALNADLVCCFLR